MGQGIPGLAGTEHVGLTVPDLEEATRFFVEVIGCTPLYDVGPYQADDDWMQDHLNVHPRATIRKLRMVKCATGPAIELFEYTSPDQRTTPPRNSDHGAAHLGFYVTDIAAAVAHLKAHGVKVLGEPSLIESGPSAGLNWVYFLAPWGTQMELVSYPQGMAYEATSAERLWSPVTGNPGSAGGGN